MVQHRRMLAPITSIKHYVHRANSVIATGNVLTHSVVIAVAKGAARALPSNVEEGAVVKAVHLEYWICGTLDAATSQFAFIVYKLPAGQVVADATDMANLGSWDNKKNILFSSQGVLPEGESSQSIPVIREWIKIPKGKQRFGLNDSFRVTFFSVGTLQVCGLATYKEYD